MWLPKNASKGRIREAENARRNRREVVKARSTGQISRRELLKWGLITAGGALAWKQGLNPFVRSAYASIPTFPGPKVRQAQAFIDAHLGERLTLPDIAGLLEMSPYHFAHVFKRATGIAPHQYVIRRRMERGKELLVSTDLPIADIALAVGFANQSHFSAAFHRATGLTPQAYRSVRQA